MNEMELTLQAKDLLWQSDWNGDEVGFDDVSVVGFYTQERQDGIYNYYIDVETYEILDFWKSEEE